MTKDEELLELLSACEADPNNLSAARDLAEALNDYGQPWVDATPLLRPACSCCDLIYASRRQYESVDGAICDDCRNTNYVYAADTGNLVHVDNGYADDHGNFFEYEPERKPSSALGNYHGHPLRRERVCHHPHGNPPILVGVEWEMLLVDEDDRSDAARHLQDLTDFCVAEEDGSLDDDLGMEVVTGYTSLPLMNQWLTQIHDHTNPDSSEGCGLHVNVSKLSREAGARLIYFLGQHRNFHEVIAGRWGEHYAKPTVVNSSDEALDILGSLPKYSNVNPHLGYPDYYELRLFAGSTQLKRVLARVQYGYACALFCLLHEQDEDLQPATFSRWLLDNEDLKEPCKQLLELHFNHFQTFVGKKVSKVWVRLVGDSDKEVAEDAPALSQLPLNWTPLLTRPSAGLAAIIHPETNFASIHS